MNPKLAESLDAIAERLNRLDARLGMIESGMKKLEHGMAILLDEVKRHQGVRLRELDRRIAAIEGPKHHGHHAREET